MNRGHLHYTAGHSFLGSHPIRVVPPKEKEKNNDANYVIVKREIRNAVRSFVSSKNNRDQQKQALVQAGQVDQETINELESYYLVIETYGRVPSFFQRKFEQKFRSTSFVAFYDFNRKAVVHLSGQDLQQFLNTMNEIGNYETESPRFHPNHSLFKLVRHFEFFSDRIDHEILNQIPKNLLIKVFNVSSSRREKIHQFLQQDFEVQDIGRYFLRLVARGEGASPELLKKIAGVVDDIELITSSANEIIIDDLGQVLSNERYSLDESFGEDTELETVAVIDSGVSENREVLLRLNRGSLNRIVVDDALADPLKDPKDHGTAVASLIAFGDQIQNGSTVLKPDARIVSVQTWSLHAPRIDFIRILDAIKELHSQGVRIFNLSMGFPKKIKTDNSMYSEFAVLIDGMLALEQYRDLLIFIAVGNLTDKENVPSALRRSELLRSFDQNHIFHWGTNLMCPADGINAFSIGSINQIGMVSAFTRKHCLDYATILSDRRNLPTYWIAWCARIRKPDMVMNGEELKVLSSDIDQERIANGTSFSTPLATNMAAKIWNLYPSIRANTVKALLINSCSTENILLSYDINNRSTLPDPIATRLSTFNCDGQLREEKKSIEQRYIGHGQPDADRAMFSNENRVTLILEDEIELNSQKSYELALPAGRNIFEGKGSFRISAALTFNAAPVATDHLDYNPILISFRIISCDPNLYRSLVEERKTTSREYQTIADQYETSGDSSLIPEIKRLEKALEDIETRIKGHIIQKWSQDNYYHYQYSNTQKIEHSFLKKTLRNKTNNGVLPLFLEVRCNIKSRDKKSHIFKAMQDFIEQDQNVIITEFSELQSLYKPQFSFAFTLEDSNQDLYVDLLEANANRVEVLATVEAEAVAEVDNSV